jgi:hypothetical protein
MKETIRSLKNLMKSVNLFDIIIKFINLVDIYKSSIRSPLKITKLYKINKTHILIYK